MDNTFGKKVEGERSEEEVSAFEEGLKELEETVRQVAERKERELTLRMVEELFFPLDDDINHDEINGQRRTVEIPLMWQAKDDSWRGGYWPYEEQDNGKARVELQLDGGIVGEDHRPVKLMDDGATLSLVFGGWGAGLYGSAIGGKPVIRTLGRIENEVDDEGFLRVVDPLWDSWKREGSQPEEPPKYIDPSTGRYKEIISYIRMAFTERRILQNEHAERDAHKKEKKTAARKKRK